MSNTTDMTALLGDVAFLKEPKDNELRHLDVNDIIIGEYQVRSRIDESAPDFLELRASVAAIKVQTPITVRLMDDGSLLLCSGERRLRAARLEGLPTIPSLVKIMTDEEFEDAQFAENIHRENLSELDIARKVKRDFERLGSMDAVAKKLKKSISWVSQYISAGTLGQAALHSVQEGLSTKVDVIAGLNAVEKKHGTDVAMRVVKAVEEEAKKPDAPNVRDILRKETQKLKPSAHREKTFMDKIVEFINSKPQKGMAKIPGIWLDEHTELDPVGVSETEASLREVYLAGYDCKTSTDIMAFFSSVENTGMGRGLLRSAAFAIGLKQQDFSLESILQTVIDHIAATGKK